MSNDVKAQLVALLPRLRRFARGLTGSIDEGDDLVQSACVRALSNLDQWQAGSRLDSWMFRIIHNLSRDRYRAKRSRGDEVGADLLAEIPGEQGDRTAEAVLTLADVGRIISALPESQRVVLMLIVVDGLSYEQTAQVLDLPIGTVTSRLARARQRIAEGLDSPETRLSISP